MVVSYSMETISFVVAAYIDAFIFLSALSLYKLMVDCYCKYVKE